MAPCRGEFSKTHCEKVIDQAMSGKEGRTGQGSPVCCAGWVTHCLPWAVQKGKQAEEEGRVNITLPGRQPGRYCKSSGGAQQFVGLVG